MATLNHLPTSPFSRNHRVSIEVTQLASRLSYVFLLIAGVGISMLVMDTRSLGPLGVNPLSHGAVISVLWCVGLLVWALRVTRSHQSRFGLKTLLVVTSAIAIGLLNPIGTMLTMSLVFMAMIFDFGVRNPDSNRIVAYRILQVVAGLTGLAHTVGVMYRELA